MSSVEEYFKKKADKLSFIELKEGAYIDINDYLVDDSIPLPILTNTLVKEIKNGIAYNEIKVSYLIQGIIYVLGVDPDFDYADEYKKILLNYDKNIEDYLFYMGLRNIEKNMFENGVIYFRALLTINKENKDALLNYGICLEEKAKRLYNVGNFDEANLFINEATNVIESILDIDEKYSLAYYKLGYYYKFCGQFLKAAITWEKFLQLDNNEERKSEIREALLGIDDDVKFEKGCNCLANQEYGKALSNFLSLKEKYSAWWNLDYMIGLTYMGMGDFNNSIVAFNESIDINPNQPDVYNDLAISLFNIGKFQESIDCFTKGIELDSNNYRLLFNRGLVFMELGLYENSYVDISKATELCPDDVTLKKYKKELEIIINEQSGK